MGKRRAIVEQAQGDELRSEIDSASTQLISRRAKYDGVPFQWWAVGRDPSLVTVSTSRFGSANGFTESDPETFAMELIRKLIRGAAPEVERRESDRN